MVSFAAMLAVSTILCGFTIISFGDFQRILTTQVATSAQKADLIGQVTTSLAEMRGQQQFLIADVSDDKANGEQRRELLRASSAKMDRLLGALGPLLTEPKEMQLFRTFADQHEAWMRGHQDLTQRCADCHSAGIAGAGGTAKQDQLDRPPPTWRSCSANRWRPLRTRWERKSIAAAGS